jgi:hypothetical protein
MRFGGAAVRSGSSSAPIEGSSAVCVSRNPPLVRRDPSPPSEIRCRTPRIDAGPSSTTGPDLRCWPRDPPQALSSTVDHQDPLSTLSSTVDSEIHRQPASPSSDRALASAVDPLVLVHMAQHNLSKWNGGGVLWPRVWGVWRRPGGWGSCWSGE